MPEDGWFSNESATFGDRVAAAREGLGMTQEDLAKRLGVKLKTIRNWEDDVAEPRANKLQMMSGILNVSLTWLLSGEGDGVSGPVEGFEMTADIRALLGELADVRAEMARSADRLALVERRLKQSLKAQVV